MEKFKNTMKGLWEKLKTKIDFKNNKKRHIVGLVILAVQLVATITMIVYMNMLNILPGGLYAIVITVLIVALLLNLGLNITKKVHILGKVIGVLATAVICFGCYYLHYAVGMLHNITSEHYDVDNYLVVTLVDNKDIDSITDVAGKTVGLAENGGTKEVIESVKKELESRTSGTMTYKTYEDMSYLVSALFDKDVEVIVYMEAYDAILEEVLDYYAGSIKVIDTIEVKTLIKEDNTTSTESTTEKPSVEAPTEEKSTENDDLNQNVNVYNPALDPNAPGGGGYIGGDNTKDNASKGPITDRTFNVYISGIDRYGKVSGKSRSDVNILMTVNPMTKEILLTNTPRDYYVPIPGITTGTWRDKLTHAGLYGVWSSVATLENVYNIDIDYYVRVNFTSFIDIIDAIGGVEVYSAYTFTGKDGYKFTKGMNNITSGRMALSFARERYAFKAGDNQRGRNHMAIIEGIIKKAISPALLTNFVEIVNTISTSLQTNMTMDEITALAKMQLEDGSSWTIKQQYVTGTGAMRKCYSWRSYNSSVQLPNQDSIDACRTTIKSLMSKYVEKQTTTEEPTTSTEDSSETTSKLDETTSMENTTTDTSSVENTDNTTSTEDADTSTSETTSTSESTSQTDGEQDDDADDNSGQSNEEEPTA